MPASRYAEFAILRGDPSDGLPGVPGVGEKTARALVQAYGSIDDMLGDAATDEPAPGPLKGKPALRARLLAEFSGKKVSVADIEKFVLVETAFREIHYKGILKGLEKEATVL